MRALDYKSVSTVAKHIDGLISRGWLIKKDNSARSLIVRMPGKTSTESFMQINDSFIEKKLREKIEDLENDEDKQVIERTLELFGFGKKQ